MRPPRTQSSGVELAHYLFRISLARAHLVDTLNPILPLIVTDASSYDRSMLRSTITVAECRQKIIARECFEARCEMRSA
jgi:hypothetical protein